MMMTTITNKTIALRIMMRAITRIRIKRERREESDKGKRSYKRDGSDRMLQLICDP